MKQSRREWIKTGAALLCGAALSQRLSLHAKTPARVLNRPLGLQLYSVRDLLPNNYSATLNQIGALGYREVESAGYFNHSAAEVKDAMERAGLKLVSAHYSSDDLHKNLDQILDFHHNVGASYIICSYPGFKDPSRGKNLTYEQKGLAFNLDDWRWNADQFNEFGEKVAAAGMKFGYHNHTVEFRETQGVSPYDELMRLTDPTKVTMEMDCGWVIVGGGDPIALLKRYPKRITMLHVKDFVTSKADPSAEPKPAELGRGSIDYRPILAQAAKSGRIAHCFVEQEAFDLAPMECLKIDAAYMHNLGAT